MEQPAINDHLVRRYILGELPERERERLEVGLLADDRYYETLTALEDEIEDELIDQYLDGELTHEEREKFERAFLNTPARAHKLKVIRDLKDHSIVSGLRESQGQKNLKDDRDYGQWLPAIAIFQNPLFGFSSAAALTLALLCCVWLWMRANNLEAQLRQARVANPTDSGPRDRLVQLEKDNQNLKNELRLSEEKRHGLAQELALAKGQDAQKPPPPDRNSRQDNRSFYASLTLSSGLRSGSGNANTLTLLPHNTEARLTIDVDRVDPKDYKRVRAVVKKQAGPEVWSRDNLELQRHGQNARLLLKVPVDRLAEDGLYVAELEGLTSNDQFEHLGFYTFRVVRK
jgi:hypothetical protein